MAHLTLPRPSLRPLCLPLRNATTAAATPIHCDELNLDRRLPRIRHRPHTILAYRLSLPPTPITIYRRQSLTMSN